MNLHKIPILTDNYVWLLSNNNRDTIIIDPGIALPIINYLEQFHLSPKAILLTHYHNDHCSGVSELIERYQGINIYGPKNAPFNYLTDIVKEGDKINIASLDISIIDTPGHMPNHISYYCEPYLFLW